MADHWRAPHSREEAVREMQLRRVNYFWSVVLGALTGPLVALGFALAVMWLAGIIA